MSSRHLQHPRRRRAYSRPRTQRELEELLLPLRKEVVRPFDRRPECLLTRFGVASASEHVEALGESVEDLSWREHLRSRSRELNGEREVVEAAAHFGDLVRGIDLRPFAEQRDGFGLGKRRNRILDLALDAQQFPRGHEQREVRARPEQRRERRCSVDHLLEVVEQQQQPTLTDVRGKFILGAERMRDRLEDKRRSAQCRQPDPEDAGLVVRDERPCRLQGQARLTRPTGTGQRHQASALLDPGEHLSQLAVPTDERARRPRQVRVGNRLERRKPLLSELEDRDRLGKVLEPMLAQIEQPVRSNERGRRGRQHHLPPMRRSCDPCRAVYLEPHIAGLADGHLARVHTHPNSQPELGQRHLRLTRRRQRVGGIGKCDEERISSRIHLDAAVRRPGHPRHPMVPRQQFPICRRTEVVQQPRRALDIGEHKRHRPSREVLPHSGSFHPTQNHVQLRARPPVRSRTPTTFSRARAREAPTRLRVPPPPSR